MSFTGIPYRNRELRRLGAETGISVTATAALTQLLPNTQYLSLEGRNYSTAVIIGVGLSPWLTVIKTQDSLATVTDYSENAQDASTSTSVTLSSQNTLANGDALYVGSWVPFRGVDVDVDGTNSTGSRTLSVDYWNGSAWADISATDGTSGTTSLDQDGQVTWTVPTDWEIRSLREISAAGDPHGVGADVHFANVNIPHYWTRWTWNGALDSSVTLDHMLGLNRSTSHFTLVSGRPWEDFIHWGQKGWSAIEYETDAGTGNLVALVGSGNGEFRS